MEPSPVTKITPIRPDLLIKFQLCLYEKAGQPAYRDLAWQNRGLTNRDGYFSHINTSGGMIFILILTVKTHIGKWVRLSTLPQTHELHASRVKITPVN